jgi:hypothetical protein
MSAFDPETLNILRGVLDEAWSALPDDRKAYTPKSELAHRILKLAGQGERDPVRLRAAAMIGPVRYDALL